jgi:hypothetical protein
MHDAKKAIDCGMTDAAVLTFGASMLQAGIEAAKEAATRPELFELLFTEPSTAELDAELARGDALQEIDNDDGGRL